LDLLTFERPLLSRGEVVVGLDEVGRGALAGPLTIGAVVITEDASPPAGLTDSKALTAKQREALIQPLEYWAADWSLGSASALEIDRWGLRLALAVAATRALDGLSLTPTFALIDGSFNLLDAPLRFGDNDTDPPSLHFSHLAHTTIVKGDSQSATIAAASVLAKVQRDRAMDHLALEFPAYGWDANKGYGVPHHRTVLLDQGPCRHHRQTWRLR
jgi:ribonuclease HII